MNKQSSFRTSVRLQRRWALKEFENEKSLNDFIKNSKNNYDHIYFKHTKRLGKVNATRLGVHLYLRDGELYELRQSMKSGEYFIDLSAGLPKDSIEKKDEKYKLIIEIMDTFNKL